MAGKGRRRRGCRPLPRVVQGVSAVSHLPRTRAADSAATNPPAAPGPPAPPRGGPWGPGPPLPGASPALAHSLLGPARHGARTRPGRRHLRALPPAGLAAAAAPARSRRRGPASRRPAPAPRPPPPLPTPPAPARGSAPPAAPPPPGAPSRPARGRPCGSLTPPLPRRPGSQGRGLGLRHRPRGGWASGGQASRDVEGGSKSRALSPHPDAPTPPALPAVGQRKPGGAGSGLRWGRGAPPSPRPGFLFSRQTVPTGLTRPGAGRLPAGSGGHRPGRDRGRGESGFCDTLEEGLGQDGNILGTGALWEREA